eukprot:gene11906-14062_t
MQDYEEEDEFDFAAFDEAEAYENLNRELQENDDYDTDDEDGGLRNDDSPIGQSQETGCHDSWPIHRA